MTRVGSYLEKTNASAQAWSFASQNFANVANNSASQIYSIQNTAGIRLESVWLRVEAPILYDYGSPIIYGGVFQNGTITWMN